MAEYQVFVDSEIFELILTVRGSKKTEIREFLRSLKSNPFERGEFSTLRMGRKVEIKYFGKYSIYFWADHAVKEVKIVDFVSSIES